MTSAPRVFRSAVALLVVGLLALLFIVGTTLWLAERTQSYFNDAMEARDTGRSAVELRYALQTAESSQRGYLLTRNQIYLAPYGTAKTLAEAQLAEVRRLLAPAPETHAVVDRLASLIGDKFAEMDATIGLQRDRRDAEALAATRTNRGKALMDEANVFLSSIIRRADERLTKGAREQRESTSLLRLVATGGGILIVLVVGIVIFLFVRYARELAEARDEVVMLNGSLERRVRERTADLARVNDEIQRFAYIVTHDLRAPLVNIIGFTSELEGGIESLKTLIGEANAGRVPSEHIAAEARLATTVDLPEAIGFIRSSTKKMDALINAILKLSREGRRQLRPEQVNVAEVAKASLGSIQHQLSEAGGRAELRLEVSPIVTDRLSLEQIFGNLFDNAVKYRSKERPLRIDVRARPLPGDRIEIEVADNGRGIAEGDRERVFELFRRSGPQDQPGEGIGLAHVRTLVRNLGGEVTVTSALDQGAVFHVVLPARQHATESAAA